MYRPEGELLRDRKVAVTHEWFGATGGSEAVFLAIADLVPHAQRFVLWKDNDAEVSHLGESWLARTPLRRSKGLALPLMPLAWRTLTRTKFDVVISSSHAFAHTVKAGHSGTRYLSYVHSPARYLWSPAFDGRAGGWALAGPRKVLQAMDVMLSRHVHSYAANSREIQARIRKYWRRDARVIHPPVDIDFFASAPSGQQNQNRDYLIGVGRWIPYKNFDLMIEIADRARVPLVLAGSGPEEAVLRRAAARASVPVTFEKRPSRDRLRELYWGAAALLYPAHEDFGIVPVEAQACGTPVIGLKRGGLLETVVDEETGYLVDSLDSQDYVKGVARVASLSRQAVQHLSMSFSYNAFASRVAEWLRQDAG